MDFVDHSGRVFVDDPEGKLQPFKEKLKSHYGLRYTGYDNRWELMDKAKRDRLKAFVLGVESGSESPAPPREPAPTANTHHVELAEANGVLYVSGPRHVMRESVNARLKGLGFHFDYDTNLWSAPKSSLTPLKRKNLEKLIAPFVAGGGGDTRSPRQKVLDALATRKTNGWCIRLPFDLKDEAKSEGGLWNEVDSTWCLPDQPSFDRVKALKDKHPAIVAQREIVRRTNERLCVTIPFDLKDEAKSLGGLWNPDNKTWCMPDAASKAAILAKKQDQLDEAARAVAQKHLEEQRERDQLAETRRLERERKGIEVLHQEGNSKADHWPVGHKFRSRVTGKPMEVIEVKSTYYDEDGLSFGLMDDRGWAHTLYAQPLEGEAGQKVLDEATAKDREVRTKAEARKRRKEIVQRFLKDGEYTPGPHKLHGKPIAGEHMDSTAYGGGNWFVIEPDGVWFVHNNGHDGDFWGDNNILTGGAGAIGRRLPRDSELETELLNLETVFT